jgi:hypothetical protein
MPGYFYPVGWGTSGSGLPPVATGTESWVHPSYSRGIRVNPAGARNQRGAFSGRVRSDTDPNLDTFFDE